MSESIREELIKFVADLKRKDPESTWEEIAERTQAKFPDAKGLSLTGNAIRKRYNAWLRESEPSKVSDNDIRGGKIGMSQKSKKQLPQELMAYIEDYIEKDMRPVIERVSAEAAQRVFESKFSNFQKNLTDASVEIQRLPPAPSLPQTVAGSRRHAIQRGKLAGAVDANLLYLFESERNDRGCSVSRMLDIVIWNYFGIGRVAPPKLSFESSEPSHSTEEE